MSLPVSHSLVGASIMALLLPQGAIKQNWSILLFGALLANTPDFDFFFVWVLNAGVDWHRGFTHSVFFALIVTCLILSIAGRERVKFVVACGAAVLSHTMLDFLTTKRGGGVELLFPFSGERLKFGVFSFSEFEKGFYTPEIIEAISIELALFIPFFLAVLWLKGYFSNTSLFRNNI